MSDKAFGEVLRRLRTERGISQEALGHRSGLHRTYVSQLERGLKSPSLKTILRLVAVLEVDLADLMLQLQQEMASAPPKSGRAKRIP